MENQREAIHFPAVEGKSKFLVDCILKCMGDEPRNEMTILNPSRNV